ncbi:MAG: hypothetical protein VX705_05230 [Verrucomicrobiota bacterium]|nr:hypothetical protein [Verrucomicrobiota bacterium]
MRVTANSFPIDLQNQMQDLMTKQAALQKQAATGQRISKPSDDPRAMRRVLDLNSEIKALHQYRDNMNKVQEYTDVAYGSVSALKKISDRASEIATMADGMRGPDHMKAYAQEVNQMIEEAVRVANGKHRNVFMFSGTKTTTAPFEASRNTDGKISAVTYKGNANIIQTDVAEFSSVPVNFLGEGPQGIIKNTTTGSDFIRNLISLRDNLETNNATAIKETDLVNLGKDESNFITHFSNIGAIQSRLETSDAISLKRLDALDPLISQEADVDLAQTLVRLNEIQNSYTAALQTGARLLQTSLLDYVR